MQEGMVPEWRNKENGNCGQKRQRKHRRVWVRKGENKREKKEREENQKKNNKEEEIKMEEK